MFDDNWTPYGLHHVPSRHWRSGWLGLIWHYRLWFAASAGLWLGIGFGIVYAAGRWL